MCARNRFGRKQVFISAAVLAGLEVCQAHRATAATDLWTGTDSAASTNINWSDPGNWGGTTIAAGDMLDFSGANTINNNDLTGYSVAGITFNSGAGAFNLSGNAITLGPDSQSATYALTVGIINNSTSAETIGVGLTLATGNESISAASGQLNFAAITRQIDATVLFNNAGGAIHVGTNLTSNLVNGGTVTGNDSSGGGGIVGGWATIDASSAGNGSGGWATINASGNLVLFTNYNSNSGSFTTSVNGNEQVTQADSTSKITASSGDNYVDMNTLIWSPSSNSGNELIEANTASQTIRLGVDGGIMSVDGANRTVTIGNGSSYSLTAGGPTNNSAGEITLNSPFTTISGRSVINSVIENNGSGEVTVNIGSGYWDIKEVATYSGGTYISNGEMLADAGSGKSDPLGTGPIYVYPGGRVDFGSDNQATINNNIFIAGYGFNNGGSPGAIKGTYQGTISGTITLMSSASIDPNAGSGGWLNLTGPITGTGSLTFGGSTSNLVAGTTNFGSGAINSYTGNLIVDASSGSGGGTGVKFESGANNLMQIGGIVSLIGGSSVHATFDVNGTSQSVNGLTSPSGTVSNAIVGSSTSGGLVTLNGSGSNTFAGLIEGGFGSNPSYLSLTMNGTGAQVLSGANTYTGNTTINNGILSITGSLAATAVTVSGGTLAGTGNIAGAVTLNSGAINPGVTGPGSVGTLTLNGGLTVNGGNLGFDLGINGSGDVLTVNGTGVNFAGTSTLTPIGGTPGYAYTVISSAAMTGSTLPTLIEPATTRLSYAYDPSSYNGSNGATSVIVDVSGQTANLTWNNAAGGDGVTWDVVGNLNWASNATLGNPNQFYQGDNVTFNDSNNGNYNVSLNTTVSPGSVTVITDGAYIISGSGSIVGAGGLSMSSNSGNGSLTLSTANTFSGGTTLNSGTLNINNAAALGTGMLTINGGTIDNTSAAPITMANNIAQTWTGNFTFTGTQSLSMGSGAVTLNNTNTANTTVTVTNAAAVLTVSGSINGSGQALTKAGNGTLFLSGNSSFSGGVTVNAGTLEVTSVGGGASALGSGVTTVNAGATLVGAGADAFGYGSATTNSAGIVIVGGTVTDLGSSIYRVTMPNLTFTGGTLTSAAGNTGGAEGNYSLFGNGSGACTITTNPSSTTAVINAYEISLQEPTTFNIGQGNTSSGVDMLISSTIVPYGSQPLIMAGPGVLQLTGANTDTGATNITGGTLTVPILAIGGAASGIGASNNSAGNLILNGGTLQYTGAAVTTDRLFTLGPNGGSLDASGTGAVNFNNPGATAVTFSGSRTLTLTGTNSGNNTLAASIGDSALSGSTNVVKNGIGTWVLSGSSSFSGGVTINSGALSVTGSLTGSGPVNIMGGKLWGTGAITGPVTLSGGTIDPGPAGSGSIGTLTMNGGLTISTGTDNLNFDIGSSSNDQINASNGTVAFDAPSSLGLTGGANGGIYTLITSSSMTGTFIPTLVEPTTTRVFYSYDPASYNGSNNATSLIVDVTASPATLLWNNSGLSGDGLTWDVGTSQNWNSSASSFPNVFLQGDSVIFNDNNNGNYNVSLGVQVLPGSITVNTNGAYNISGGGSIGGTGSLSLSSNSGAGSLTLATTNNNYSGGTTINSGTLNANTAGALGTGPVVVNGGTLNINNAAALSTATLTLNAGSTIDNTSAGPITLSTVTPEIWTGNFTFTGTQNLNMGSGSVTLESTNASSTTVTVANSDATLAITGNINGNGTNGSGQALVKAGPGTLFLSGNNNFSGGVTVSAGTLEVTSSGNGNSGLGSANTSVIVSSNGTLIGGGADAFGYNASNPGLMTIYINGGTVTDLPGAYRVTLPNISFTGGTLTSNASNTGKTDGSGEFSLYAGTVETNPSSTTAVISAKTISLQDLNDVVGTTTFDVDPGSVTGGSYPGVDLYVSSNLVNYPGEISNLTKIGSGKMEVAGSNTYTGGTVVAAGTLIFNGSAALPVFSSLTVAGSGTVAQVANRGANPISVLQVSTLINSGLVDLTNNDMVVRSGNLASITQQVADGYAGGTWQGSSGITSSAAAADTTHLTALGVIVNDNGSGTPLYGVNGTIASSFDGAATVDGDILVKYTYYGDANLDGVVDASDYSRIDNGYLNHLTGWSNGDFNYDGVVNGSDYTLIDNAYNMQGPSLATQIASATDQIAGGASAVPEPAISTLLGIAAAGLLGRRRRR